MLFSRALEWREDSGLVDFKVGSCAGSRTKTDPALFRKSPIPVDGEFEFTSPVETHVQSEYLIRDLVLEDPPFGFSVRGGRERGVTVSGIVIGSPADRAQLTSGDRILSANGISFTNIRHRDAIQVLCSQKKLKLTILRKGSPGWQSTFPTSATEYCHMWVDRHGRAVSPPVTSSPSFDLPLDHPSLKRTASYREGKDTRTFRKVIVIRQPGLPLGLMVRGGAERRLGIFVSGVQEASSADYAGLQVGDQILSVNDQDFTMVTRAEAIDILETTPRMSIVVKSLGKMPRSPIPSMMAPEPYANGSDMGALTPPWYNDTVQQTTSNLTRKRSSRKKKVEEVRA